MIIDGREITTEEFFISLKETLRAELGRNVSIKVLVNTSDVAKRTLGFVSMSGCQGVLKNEEGHYILHITGTPCCI